MANTPTKIKDPTEAALSAIQDALSARDAAVAEPQAPAAAPVAAAEEPTSEWRTIKSATLDMTFPAENGSAGMKDALDSLCARAELSVRDGINILVLSRSLAGDVLDAIANALPAPPKSGPRFEPLFMTKRNMDMSLDSFPIEWLEIQERHLLLEGEDVVGTLEVPQTYLRLQCEHELRGKLIQLRQAYLDQYLPTVENRACRSIVDQRRRGDSPNSDPIPCQRAKDESLTP